MSDYFSSESNIQMHTTRKLQEEGWEKPQVDVCEMHKFF